MTTYQTLFLIPLAISTLVTAWLPETDKTITSRNGTNLFASSKGKIRGVNMGSQFVFEPWIAEKAWSSMGCKGQKSEFDCVVSLGQDAANKAFAQHWGSWITQDDITEIQSYTLNTIRVPIGYWMKEDLVNKTSEHFPQGGFAYLEKLCGWASDAGLYIILDLHGAPGAQTPHNPFTGQYASTAGFYNDYQFGRALEFLEWITTKVHQSDSFRNVGMLEIVNEPLQNAQKVGSMRSTYYPDAFKRIRAAEQKLNVSKSGYLHIQMMDKLWGSGDPEEYLTDKYYVAYDDHRYLKWDPKVNVSKENYISTSCSDELDSNTPTIVGEWSLSVPDDVASTPDWDMDTNKDFYKKWFAAQITAYEKQRGWVFWTWKTQLGGYRWSYKGMRFRSLQGLTDNDRCGCSGSSSRRY